ncbi:MAG: DUF429 domain-containing protein, partial [Lachnospiraceae bacterium]|nr:DUF429 domain-containing protein [Lachnospiraceae bacterium]
EQEAPTSKSLIKWWEHVTSLEEICDEIPFDTCIIDMVIGLQSKESDVRPDSLARHELKRRASTIFPAPCRQAVYGETKEERIAANVEVLGKKFTSQIDYGIIEDI